MSVPDSLNECITLEEMKYLARKHKKPLPLWLRKPAKHNIMGYDMPLEVTLAEFRLEQDKQLRIEEVG